MATGEGLSVRVPRDARWSCEGCGLCCRFHELGPVEPEIIADLESRDLASRWPAAAERGWYQTRPGPDGQPTAWLTKQDGACIFLAEDNRCGLHAAFGAEAKPGFCRSFPFVAVRDPKGVSLVARPGCGSFPVTAQTGELLADQALPALKIPHSRMHRVFQPDTVEIVSGAGVDLERWMEIEAEVLPTLHALDMPPEGLVAAVRGRLLAAAGASAPRPDPARYRMALTAMLEAMRMVMDHVIATESAPSPAEADFAQEMHDRIGRTRAQLGEPMPALAPDARSYLNLLLRSLLLGKHFTGIGTVGGGMGLYLLNAAVARYDAVGDGPVTAEALGGVHPQWTRFTQNQSMNAILKKARPALDDLFLHAQAD